MEFGYKTPFFAISEKGHFLPEISKHANVLQNLYIRDLGLNYESTFFHCVNKNYRTECRFLQFPIENKSIDIPTQEYVIHKKFLEFLVSSSAKTEQGVAADSVVW